MDADWSTEINRLQDSTWMFDAPIWDDVQDNQMVEVRIPAKEYRAIQRARKALRGEVCDLSAV